MLKSLIIKYFALNFRFYTFFLCIIIFCFHGLNWKYILVFTSVWNLKRWSRNTFFTKRRFQCDLICQWTHLILLILINLKSVCFSTIIVTFVSFGQHIIKLIHIDVSRRFAVLLKLLKMKIQCLLGIVLGILV